MPFSTSAPRSGSARLSRRGVLALGVCLAAGAGAPAALAAPALRFPMRVAYARIGPGGFIHLRQREQEAWSALDVRLGGLMETIAPLQPGDMLGAQQPAMDGGASCALIARARAAERGCDQVILYATHDGQTSQASDAWMEHSFSSMRGSVDGRAFGEAHLLDVSGGAPVLSASADAPRRKLLNLFDDHRNPEAETLASLTLGIERGIQQMARAAYADGFSIADGALRPRQ